MKKKKVFIVYKFSGVNKEVLRRDLEEISAAIESIGHGTFIFSRDVQKWGRFFVPKRDIMRRAFSEIVDSDVIFGFFDTSEKSRGSSLEIGYAKGLGKEFVLVKKEAVDVDYLDYVAEKVIEFRDIDDLVKRIKAGDVL